MRTRRTRSRCRSRPTRPSCRTETRATRRRTRRHRRPGGARWPEGWAPSPSMLAVFAVFAASSHRPLDGIAEGLEDAHASPLLVVRFDQVPGRHRGAGPVDQVADRPLVGVPLLAIAPVVRGDLEPLERRLLARLEPGELLFLADREPELHDDDAPAREGVFEVDDLAVSAHPVGFRGEALDPLDEHTPVPASIEEHDA